MKKISFLLVPMLMLLGCAHERIVEAPPSQAKPVELPTETDLGLKYCLGSEQMDDAMLLTPTYDIARENFGQKCQAGRTYCCYQFGIWIERNANDGGGQATKFFQLGCQGENGLGKSCRRWGQYVRKQGDATKAQEIFHQGCQKGDDMSCRSASPKAP